MNSVNNSELDSSKNDLSDKINNGWYSNTSNTHLSNHEMNNYNQNLTSNNKKNYCSSSTNFSQNNDMENDSDGLGPNDIKEIIYQKKNK